MYKCLVCGTKIEVEKHLVYMHVVPLLYKFHFPKNKYCVAIPACKFCANKYEKNFESPRMRKIHDKHKLPVHWLSDSVASEYLQPLRHANALVRDNGVNQIPQARKDEIHAAINKWAGKEFTMDEIRELQKRPRESFVPKDFLEPHKAIISKMSPVELENFCNDWFVFFFKNTNPKFVNECFFLKDDLMALALTSIDITKQKNTKIYTPKCASCGTQIDLTRHHLTPRMFMDHMPIHWHGIYTSKIRLCRGCHSCYENNFADSLKDKIFEEHGLPPYNKALAPQHTLKNYCMNLASNEIVCSDEKKKEYLEAINKWAGRECSMEEIKEFARKNVDFFQSPETVDQCVQVVRRMNKEEAIEFCKRWCSHFFSNMNLRFLDTFKEIPLNEIEQLKKRKESVK